VEAAPFRENEDDYLQDEQIKDEDEMVKMKVEGGVLNACQKPVINREVSIILQLLYNHLLESLGVAVFAFPGFSQYPSPPGIAFCMNQHVYQSHDASCAFDTIYKSMDQIYDLYVTCLDVKA
jgi:hypothetical protein